MDRRRCSIILTPGMTCCRATIDLRPLGQSAVSDPDGRFSIANVKPGDYTLTVSYVGLQPFKKAISVQAAQIVRVDAVLQVPGVQEELTVSAERPRGEAAALNEQRTSPNIVQILPAEVITSLPNTTWPTPIGRLPSVSLERDEGEGKYVQIRGTDPRLSNLTINGVHVPSPESGRAQRQARHHSLGHGRLDRGEQDAIRQPGCATLSAGSVNLVTKVPGEKPFASAGLHGRLYQHRRWPGLDAVHGDAPAASGRGEAMGRAGGRELRLERPRHR